MTSNPPLPSLSTARLTPIARRVLGQPSAEVTSWVCEPFHGRNAGGFTAGVQYVGGSARVRGRAAL